jgi:hypothetical protein
MFTDYPAIKSILAGASGYLFSESDAVLYIVTIFHERADFCVCLPGEDNRKTPIGEGTDRPV